MYMQYATGVRYPHPTWFCSYNHTSTHGKVHIYISYIYIYIGFRYNRTTRFTAIFPYQPFHMTNVHEYNIYKIKSILLEQPYGVSQTSCGFCCEILHQLKTVVDRNPMIYTHDGFMYGIYADIWGTLMVNVTIYIYTIHTDPMGQVSTCLNTIHRGNNFDAVVQLAERVDEALLDYQHRVANNEGMNRSLEECGCNYAHVMGLGGILRE